MVSCYIIGVGTSTCSLAACIDSLTNELVPFGHSEKLKSLQQVDTEFDWHVLEGFKVFNIQRDRRTIIGQVHFTHFRLQYAEFLKSS